MSHVLEHVKYGVHICIDNFLGGVKGCKYYKKQKRGDRLTNFKDWDRVYVYCTCLERSRTSA